MVRKKIKFDHGALSYSVEDMDSDVLSSDEELPHKKPHTYGNRSTLTPTQHLSASGMDSHNESVSSIPLELVQNALRSLTPTSDSSCNDSLDHSFHLNYQGPGTGANLAEAPPDPGVAPNATSPTVSPSDINWHDRDECIQQATSYLTQASEISILCSKLYEEDLLKNFVTLINLLIVGKLPVTNLPFIASLDRAQFESLGTTTQMRFRDDMKRFWATIMQIGRGRVMQVLAGRKSGGNVVSGIEEQGHFNPDKASVNFVIPCKEVLDKSLNQIPKCLHPGIIHDTFDMLDKSCQHVLMFDGKKIAPGLGEFPMGDVNLMGVEGPPSLQEKKNELDRKMDICRDIEALLDADDQSGTDNMKPQTVPHLVDLTLSFASMVKDVNQLICNCERQVTKLSSYVEVKKPQRYDFAIANEKGRIHMGKEWLSNAADEISELCSFITTIKGTKHLTQQSYQIDLKKCANYHSLHDVDTIMKNTKIALSTEIIKQRSDLWYDLRGNAVISGSSAWNGLGLRGVSEQKKHFKEYVEKRKKSTCRSKITALRMQYGTDNEINGIATLVNVFMPSLLPSCYIYKEKGSYFIDGNMRGDMLCVSPDGVLECPLHGAPGETNSQHSDHKPIAIEIKCPYPEESRSNLHFSIPVYYSLQLLLEMMATKTSKCWYISYSKDFSTLMELKNDESLGKRVFNNICTIFDKDDPEMPKGTHHEVLSLKEDLQKYIEEKSTLKFIAKSNTALPDKCECRKADSPYHKYTSTDLSSQSDIHIQMLASSMHAVQLIKDSFQLLREKGQEIIAGVITDIHRVYKPTVPSNMPIVYGLKSYSLPVTKMREFVDLTMEECHKQGVRIICQAFDGQWAPLVFKDKHNQPLTRFQLQKKIWSEVVRTSKKDLVSYFINLSTVMPETLQFWGHTKFSLAGKMSDGNVEVECQAATRHAPRKLIVGTPNNSGTEQSKYAMVQGPNSYVQPKPNVPRLRQLHRMNQNESHVLDLNDIVQFIPNYILSEDEEGADGKSMSSLHNVSVGSGISSITLDESICEASQDEDVEPDLLRIILTDLRSTRYAHKYTGMSASDLYFDLLTSTAALGRTMTVMELDRIGEAICRISGKSVFAKSDSKSVKVNKLGALFGDSEKWVPALRKRKSPTALSKLAYNALMHKEFPKEILLCAKASIQYQVAETKWDDTSTFPLYAEITGQTEVFPLFCYPEKNENRDQLEPRIIDPTHIMNNVRTKICHSGIDDFPKSVVLKLAECTDKYIKSLMLTQILDQQSSEISLRFFSQYVEDRLRSLGEDRAADFVKLFRNWFSACDARGIDPLTRVNYFIEMQNYFLKDYKLSSFPPAGRYLKGIPTQTVESILHNCSMRIIIYELADNHNVSQRALSTLGEETFFSEICFMDYSGHNCPKANQLPYLLSHVVRLNHVRNDPNRNFAFDGPQSSRYNHQKQADKLAELQINEDENFRYNLFDVPVAADHKQRIKRSHRANDVFGQEVGVHGVRLYYKTNTAKLSILQKLGLDTNQSS